MVRLCTSSGPSARRNVRIPAYILQDRNLRHAAAAMGLNGIINDLQGNARTGNFDLRDLAFGNLIADRIHHIGRFHGQKTRHFNIGAGFGMRCPKRCDRQCVCQRPVRVSKRCTFFQARARPHRLSACSGEYGQGQAPCAISKPRPSPAEGFQPVRAHLSEQLRHVRAVRHQSQYRQHADNSMPGDPAAPKLRLLLVQRGVGVGFAHHNCD